MGRNGPQGEGQQTEVSLRYLLQLMAGDLNLGWERESQKPKSKM